MPTTTSSVETTERYAHVNGVRLHVVEAGRGPLIVLLHGFPDFWYGWRHQIPTLAAAGYRVLAPDLRGYNLSDKPLGLRHYRVDVAADDVLALIRGSGAPGATIVGHDWGGFIAWRLAARDPVAVERLVILNAPHPAAFRRELRSLDQLRRSVYVLLLQLPWVPEAIIRRRDYALIRRILRRDPVRPDAFTDADVARYVEALARPGALRSALSYYRALRLRSARATAMGTRRVTTPTRVIWGDRDRYLRRQLTERLDHWVPNVDVVHLPDASHWVMADAPDEVSRLILEFLRPGRQAASRAGAAATATV
jgi:epoxide hydrolase 4